MTTTHRLLIILIVVVAVGFLYLGFRADSPDVTTTNKTVNKDFRELEMLSSAGHKVFQSENYDFTFTIDHGVEWGQGSPVVPALLSTGFSLPNPNSEAEQDRGMQIEYIPQEKNSFSLEVYKNDRNVTTRDEVFRAWRSEILKYDDANDEVHELSIAGNVVFQTIEPDGIESHVVRYYIVTSQYIYVFSTNSFTEQEMREFISGFVYER